MYVCQRSEGKGDGQQNVKGMDRDGDGWDVDG